MSKIGSDKMKAAIHEMLTTNHKDRKFKETIDLQIGLKDYDINKDKRLRSRQASQRYQTQTQDLLHC